MKKKAFHIAFATGLKRDLRYLAALVHSIVENFSRPESLTFHVLHFYLTAEDLEPLHQSLEYLPCSVQYYALDDIAGEALSKPCFGYWGRVWVPRVLDDSIDRVLYLDCDMICHRDLSCLWALDLGENFVAAVLDPGTRTLGVSQSLAESAPEYGYDFPSDGNYFNSGLLFMNLRAWRDERVLETLERKFDYRPQRFNDQDALNLLFQGRVVYVSPEWNLVESIYLYEEWDFALYESYGSPVHYMQPRLRHYSGEMKPDGLYVRESEAEDFYYYLDRTVWRGWRSEISSRWYRPVLGNLLDFHYVMVRGFKQKALEKPWTRLREIAKKAPYVLVLYPFLGVYRAYRRVRDFASRSL